MRMIHDPYVQVNSSRLKHKSPTSALRPKDFPRPSGLHTSIADQIIDAIPFVEFVMAKEKKVRISGVAAVV